MYSQQRAREERRSGDGRARKPTITSKTYVGEGIYISPFGVRSQTLGISVIQPRNHSLELLLWLRLRHVYSFDWIRTQNPQFSD